MSGCWVCTNIRHVPMLAISWWKIVVRGIVKVYNWNWWCPHWSWPGGDPSCEVHYCIMWLLSGLCIARHRTRHQAPAALMVIVIWATLKQMIKNAWSEQETELFSLPVYPHSVRVSCHCPRRLIFPWRSVTRGLLRAGPVLVLGHTRPPVTSRP